MTRTGSAQHGDGTAWLVADGTTDEYLCYWYAGRNDEHLAEQGRAGTQAAALAWGRLRTPRVRIRTSEARTYWAGSAPRPEGIMHTLPC